MISVATIAVVVAIAGLVVVKLAGKGQLTAAKWKPFLTGDLWRTYVLPGIAGTLTAAALSIVLALIVGLLLGVGRLSPNAAIRRPCAVIVEFFRAEGGEGDTDGISRSALHFLLDEFERRIGCSVEKFLRHPLGAMPDDDNGTSDIAGGQ